MSSNSWNWQVVPMSEQDIAYYRRNFETSEERFKRYYVCRKKGCGAMPDVFVSYHYVTGRRGRVSFQQRPFCREHGEQAVAAHSKPEAV